MVAGVEDTGAVKRSPHAVGAVDSDELSGPFDWLRRLAPARLTSRIILINFVGLVILVAGILYFNQSRQSLIDARVQSLMTQGRIMAAAVAASATVDTGQIFIDPDKLLELNQGDEGGAVDVQRMRKLELLIKQEQAGPVLRQLAKQSDTRARLYDREGVMVVDSHGFYGDGEILRLELAPLLKPEENILAKWWKRFNEWLFSDDYPLQKEFGLDNGKDFPEIRASLSGASVSVVRVNKNNEIIVSAAVPIQRFRAVLGALVLSTKGGAIDDVLRNERRIVIFTFLVAAVVAVLLSISLASHIAEPIRRLAASAEHVRRGINNRVEIPDFTLRRDEVGHLSGALRDMTNALYRRIDAIEAFAADVSHELKNPLTSLRSAVETLQYAKTDAQRKQLVDIVNDDVKRLDRLISDISDASRLDAELARATAQPVNVEELLENVVSLSNQIRDDDSPQILLKVQEPPANLPRDKAFIVLGHDMRLGQVLRNLLDNAHSFNPADKSVTVELRRTAKDVEFRVDDKGPGIDEANLERIFDRFYTDRPEGAFGKNSGLGLSITRQIVQAHRGQIRAENRTGSRGKSGKTECLGASFIVRIPAMAGDRKPKRTSDRARQ